MIPWRVYQQIAIDLDVPPETMHLINVLADGGYLTENQPPYLNYDLPNFGTQVTWLDEHPTQGIAFCKGATGRTPRSPRRSMLSDQRSPPVQRVI